MLKVVHLQYFVSTQGNAPFRLHDAMRKSGLNSTMMVFNTPRPATGIFYRFGGVSKLIKLYLYGMLHKVVRARIKENKNLFSFPFFIGNKVHKHPLVANSDVIYLHWINGGFLTLANIEQLIKLRKPIIFFMHDMWPITGGCHHSFGCIGYQSDCGNCPMFGGGREKTYASVEFARKKKVFSAKNLYFVSPSNWLAKCASQSGLCTNKEISRIPNLINENVFKPSDKMVARNILNIPSGVKVISFGCVGGVNNPIKGWGYLKDALKLVSKLREDLVIEVLVFGSDYDAVVESEIPYHVRFLGPINDEISMVVVNNAADVFVSPSIAESFGMTAMENIMCGTPVVVFDNGGTVDFVKHKVNGYLAEYKSTEDFAAGIIYCLENDMEMLLAPEFCSSNIINEHRHVISKLLDLSRA